MNPEHTTPLVEILSLHLKLQPSLSFGSATDGIYAERSDTRARFAITDWQMDLLMGMEGGNKLGNLLRESGFELNRDFSVASLEAFVAQLHQDALVFQTSAYAPAASPAPKAHQGWKPTNLIPKQFWRTTDQHLKIACYVIGFLGVIRFAWIVAPVFEPAIERIGIEINEVLQEEASQQIPLGNHENLLAERAPQSATIESVAPSGKSKKMERLRGELEECRIRRDEYYLQNNEDGYRKELESMTTLTRKIGELRVSE